MNDHEFQIEILKKIGNLERDLSFVKGVIEGRDHKTSLSKDNVSIGISCISLLVSVILVISRFV